MKKFGSEVLGGEAPADEAVHSIQDSEITVPTSRTGDDDRRLRAVERYRVPALTSDLVFSRLAEVAAAVFGSSMALVSLVDAERNRFVGVHGLATAQDVPREEGLCGPAIAGEIPRIVSDARADSRAAGNRFVRRHAIRSYACIPIVDAEGNALGTVAAMDTVARVATPQQLRVLESLAVLAITELDAALEHHDALRAERRERRAAENARDDALRDRDDAVAERNEARRVRDDAQSDHDEATAARLDARRDRDSALRDRDIAERDRDVIEEYATVLQKTLLPPRLPELDGLVLAAHYHPASPRQVGGDFYDFFALGEDRWAFFVGDVEGHGAEAAVATSLIRYTLRSAALHHRDPTDALTELNGVLLKELKPRRFCTVLLGTVERRTGLDGFRITVATGGHLPALLLDPTSMTAREVRPEGGILVGAFADAPFTACTVDLLPNQTLLLYTDGITEARRGAEPFDEALLAEFAAERAGLDAAGLTRDLETLIPKLDPDDDVAILAMTAR